MNFETVIFAAGIGSRLNELGKVMPKILLPVWKDNKNLEPIIQRIIRQATDAGTSKIYIIVNHFSEYIETYINSNLLGYKCDIEIITQKKLDGEAGGLFLIPQNKYPILAIDGDNYLADNTFFKKLINEYEINNSLAIIGVREVPDINRYANVLISGQNELIDIIEKPYAGMEFSNIAKMGCYVLSSKLIERGKSFFQDAEGYITTTAAFSNICRNKEKAICIKYDNRFDYLDIGTFEGYIGHLTQQFKLKL